MSFIIYGKKMSEKSVYSWAVVGAGPAGIISVGKLLDSGVAEKDILWIDPAFCVGDFGRHWGSVNSNTKVSLFLNVLKGIHSFQYDQRPQDFKLDTMDVAGFTELKSVTEPLQWVSHHLKEKVVATVGHVNALTVENGAWQLHTEADTYAAKKVILAIGSEPKSLHYPGIDEIDLVTALTPSALKTVCSSKDTVAVFGSSHSAMIIIRNLVEAGVKNIVNFYVSPFKFALLLDDWILYDDTGLKGETAQWVKENILKNTLPQIKRYVANADNITHQLPLCNKAAYAVGFSPRQLPVSGLSLSQYDESNGIIAPGLFGTGIAFPIAVTDPFGRVEKNVGLWKFLKNMNKTLPIWAAYGL